MVRSVSMLEAMFAVLENYSTIGLRLVLVPGVSASLLPITTALVVHSVFQIVLDLRLYRGLLFTG